MPAEQRKALRQQWRQMSPEQRRGALQGRAAHPNGAVRPQRRSGRW
jgi:hypothetical protein